MDHHQNLQVLPGPPNGSPPKSPGPPGPPNGSPPKLPGPPGPPNESPPKSPGPPGPPNGSPPNLQVLLGLQVDQHLQNRHHQP